MTRDFISTLPDTILHVIFSFMPTKFAIRTSALSKRWKHVWSEAPSLSIKCPSSDSDSIIETLTRYYSAPKITGFDLSMSHVTTSTTSKVDSFIEFATSHNTERLSLSFPDSCNVDCKLPLVLYDNSSLKQFLMDSGTLVTIIPTVSWTSLRNLVLSYCQLSDDSFAKVISGSPLLESLTLHYCVNLKNLDLTNSLWLSKLDIEIQGQIQIIAPHVHSLRLKQVVYTPKFQCGLFNVSSLSEADLNMSCSDLYIFDRHDTDKADSLVLMIMKMLEMLQNVEKLTFGAIFLQDRYLNNYLYYKGLDTDQCWKRKDWEFLTSSEPELMRFMEYLLENTREDYN